MQNSKQKTVSSEQNKISPAFLPLPIARCQFTFFI